MTYLALQFSSDDPAITQLLAAADAMPAHDPARLRIEAGLCTWWAERCHQKIGASEALDRRERGIVARARATRERNAAAKRGTP